MNELQIFNNPEFGEIRMIEIDGKPHAVGVDVARALEYVKPSRAVIDHCKGIRKLGIPSGRGIQETNCIPEGDIYRLIIKAADQSRNPQIKEVASRYESWIFDDVLPTIRKTGKYETLNQRQRTKEEIQAADKRSTAMLLNAKTRVSTQLQKLYDRAGVKPEYQALAISDFYAGDGINLPRIALQGTKVTYDKGA